MTTRQLKRQQARRAAKPPVTNPPQQAPPPEVQEMEDAAKEFQIRSAFRDAVSGLCAETAKYQGLREQYQNLGPEDEDWQDLQVKLKSFQELFVVAQADVVDSLERYVDLSDPDRVSALAEALAAKAE